MVRTETQHGNPANRRIDRPESAEAKQRAADDTASTRLKVARPLFGGELAGRQRISEDEETADALKRAAEIERRS